MQRQVPSDLCTPRASTPPLSSSMKGSHKLHPFPVLVQPQSLHYHTCFLESTLTPSAYGHLSNNGAATFYDSSRASPLSWKRLSVMSPCRYRSLASFRRANTEPDKNRAATKTRIAPQKLYAKDISMTYLPHKNSIFAHICAGIHHGATPDADRKRNRMRPRAHRQRKVNIRRRDPWERMNRLTDCGVEWSGYTQTQMNRQTRPELAHRLRTEERDRNEPAEWHRAVGVNVAFKRGRSREAFLRYLRAEWWSESLRIDSV